MRVGGRSLLGSLLLGATALLLCGAAAELFLRAFYPCPWYGFSLGGWQRGLYRLDPMIGKRGIPGARSPFASRDFHVEIAFDAEGNRSRIPAFVPGRRNFVALGDSFAWGWGVEGHEVWSEQLMQRDPQLNVYNLAIPGTGTDQHYLLLADYLERHPDATLEGVILIFCCNDFRNVVSDQDAKLPKPRFRLEQGELVLTNVPIPERYAQRFTGRYDPGEPEIRPAHHSHLHNLLNRGIPRLIGIKRSPSAPAGPEADPLVQRLILAIRDAAKARGAELRVAVLESRTELDRFRALERFLAAEGIPVAGLAPRRFPQRRLWLDGHFSASGHRELAELVHGLLKQPNSS